MSIALQEQTDKVLISSGDGAAPTWQNASSVGTTDHGALTGLTDDDHTQYALLAGRDGDTLAIDQVNAYDGAGLKLYDDGGNGMFVADGEILELGRFLQRQNFMLMEMRFLTLIVEIKNSILLVQEILVNMLLFSVNDSDFIIEHKQDETTGVYGEYYL